VIWVQLALEVFKWWVGSRSDASKHKEAMRKEISDAVNSGDVSSINALIVRLRQR